MKSQISLQSSQFQNTMKKFEESSAQLEEYFKDSDSKFSNSFPNKQIDNLTNHLISILYEFETFSLHYS